MTVFVYVNHNHPFPGEQEVTSASTSYYGNKEPSVVRHCYQHQQVADRHLQDM